MRPQPDRRAHPGMTTPEHRPSWWVRFLAYLAGGLFLLLVYQVTTLPSEIGTPPTSVSLQTTSKTASTVVTEARSSAGSPAFTLPPLAATWMVADMTRTAPTPTETPDPAALRSLTPQPTRWCPPTPTTLPAGSVCTWPPPASPTATPIPRCETPEAGQACQVASANDFAPTRPIRGLPAFSADVNGSVHQTVPTPMPPPSPPEGGER